MVRTADEKGARDGRSQRTPRRLPLRASDARGSRAACHASARHL